MKALVVGMGRSGLAARALLGKEGYQLTCVDQNPQGERVGSDRVMINPFDFDLVVLSPGVPGSHPLVLQADHKGVQVVGEMELGLRFLQNRAIGITGTNGKTTTTMLLAHALQRSGKKASTLGNIGTPLCEYLLDPDPDEILVLEFSSFQLETCLSKKLDSAVILNITPDHLDRYPNFAAYAKAKCAIAGLIKEGRELWLGDGVKKIFETYWPTRDTLAYNELQILQSFGVTPEIFQKAKEDFIPPAHRLELAGVVRGVHFVNDSKATNGESVLHALKKVQGPIILLAGGRDKGADFAKWLPFLRGKVRKVFAFGEAGKKIEEELGKVCELKRFATLEESFEKAAEEASEGETVLLSPGCSSFDAFANFEKRGERFTKMVKELS